MFQTLPTIESKLHTIRRWIMDASHPGRSTGSFLNIYSKSPYSAGARINGIWAKFCAETNSHPLAPTRCTASYHRAVLSACPNITRQTKVHVKRLDFIKVWLQNVVKCGKYSPVKFANFVYFCITRGKVSLSFNF